MAPSSFESLKAPGVTVNARLVEGVLMLEMLGAVDARDAGAVFDAYWSRTDAAIRKEGIRKVELDLRGLEFMNSSGLLTIVRWLTKVKDSPGYEMAIHYDRELTWQRTNVPVLAKLAPTVVRLPGA